MFGSIAKPFEDGNRPPDINEDHTHKWSVFVKGVDGEDISYWLKKVQFKLHETYPDSLRTLESPPFEVTETGWGEFEVQIKLYFVAEANEKPQNLYHGLKLHPYGADAESQRARKDPIVSQHYEEVLFNEPVEVFYDLLTSGAPTLQGVGSRGKGAKGSKQAAFNRKAAGAAGASGGGERTAELPYAETPGNPYCLKTEGAELDRLKEAVKSVEAMVREERARLAEREKALEELRRGDGRAR